MAIIEGGSGLVSHGYLLVGLLHLMLLLQLMSVGLETDLVAVQSDHA